MHVSQENGQIYEFSVAFDSQKGSRMSDGMYGFEQTLLNYCSGLNGLRACMRLSAFSQAFTVSSCTVEEVTPSSGCCTVWWRGMQWY